MSTCRHCGRAIEQRDGLWIDPEATGDDSVWRETCDSHDAFVADHEPDMTAFVDEMVRHYAICALWSSIIFEGEHEGEPIDAHYGLDDVSDETWATFRDDCTDFVNENRVLIEQAINTGHYGGPEQVGHDFWLTRNHHGAGFWDRGLGDVGEHLTKASNPYGEVYLWVGADGKVEHS